MSFLRRLFPPRPAPQPEPEPEPVVEEEPPPSLVEQVAALPEADRAALARLLAPALADELMRTHTVWGDPARLSVGREVHLVNTLFNTTSGRITVGDYVFFGHNVCVLTGTHDVAARDADRQTGVPPEGRDIHIGRGAWIASNAIVTGGVTIGDHAVIGAGSLVLSDCEGGWFHAGVPAKPVRRV